MRYRKVVGKHWTAAMPVGTERETRLEHRLSGLKQTTITRAGAIQTLQEIKEKGRKIM
jgi:hypothetical protein